MWLIAVMSVLLSVETSQPAPDETISMSELETVTQQLQNRTAENLTAARSLVAKWYQKPTDKTAAKAFQQRVTVLQSLREEILRQLRVAAKDAVTAVVADLWEKSPNASKNKSTPAAVVPAEQLYRLYLPHFRYSINTGGLQQVEKAFLIAYYNAEVQATISEIMRSGRALGTASDQRSRELEYYLVLLPLLHRVKQFSVESLRELPDWMMTPEHLKTLADFCLFRAGRLDAAEAISLNMRGQEVTRQARYAFYMDAVERSIAARAPGVAVDCLKVALTLLEADDARIIELRTRVYEVWAGAQNWALAAGEAGQLAHDYPGTLMAGRALVQRIKYLAIQGDYETILREVDDVLKMPQCSQSMPELQYYKWKALRQTGHIQAASLALKQFLERYPEDINGAEMYYVVAVDCLSAQRYDEALRILELLKKQYPEVSYAHKAQTLIEKLSQVQEPSGSEASSQPVLSQ